MNKTIWILTLVCCSFLSKAQVMSLDAVFKSISLNNPSLKMYDADIRSMDEIAKGARSWMPPEAGVGFFMTPYNVNLWKGDGMGTPAMGQMMFSMQQMFPNKSRLDAQSKYMLAMSSVDKEKKNYTLNQLYAEAKKNYFEWAIDQRKLGILEQDKRLLDFMLQSAELRYRNGMGKISAYYKVQAAQGKIENMVIMLESDIEQRRIVLNTLMYRDQKLPLEIDTVFAIREYSSLVVDSTSFINARSDIKAIERNIQLANLQASVERAKLKPEFGIRYDNMVPFKGSPLQFSLMGMVKIPIAPWSSKMNKANIEGIKWKAVALHQQRSMVISEAEGMTASLLTDFTAKKKQVQLFENNILPALKKNYQTMQIGYEQNTEELFMLFDAWETLDMTQLEYTDQLRQLLLMQVELEKLLEIK
jgi:outer membrane protein TolC